MTTQAELLLIRERVTLGAWMRMCAQVGWLLGWGGLGVCALSVPMDSPVGLSGGTAMTLGGWFLISLARLRQGGLSPITLYALSSAVAALANAVGMASADGPNRYQYFIFANDRYLMFAAELMFAGAVLPVLGFTAIAEWKGARILLSGLPRVYGPLTPRRLMVWGTVLSAISILLRVFGRMPGLGTLTDFFLLLPVLVVFSLARMAGATNDARALRLALVIAGVETFRAVLFSYIRAEMILPMFAVVTGLLFGARNIRVLRRPVLYPLYGIAIAFVIYFGALGTVRTSLEGTDRFAALAVEQQRDASLIDGPNAQAERARSGSLLARLTNFNQLTRVRQLTDEQGFYEGATLEYLGYVFIPRLLWPEKPKIEKGAWFAFAIGQAYLSPEGRYNNSINMTVQGELYLNFGWFGVIIGCMLFGAIMGVFWIKTEFWDNVNNAMGTAFGFHQFWLGAFLGADLQLVVAMLALYLFCAAVGFAMTLMSRQR